jgi:hypothetical protein
MINVSVLRTGTVVVPRARYRRLVRRSRELGYKQPTDRLPHGNTLHLTREYSALRRRPAVSVSVGRR